jgi:poly-gamma-glutamate synthesis protein (capsule biosynthesis protein)
VTDQIVLRIGAESGFRIVENIILSPVSRIGDPAEDVRLDAVQAGVAHVAPLESVTLPDIALPVEGLFPDQPGYPLHGEVAVGLRSDDQDLRAWFDSLPPAAPAADNGIFWIGAVGDIMPARGADDALLSPDGVQRVFGDTLPALRSCTLLLGNLESTAASGGARTSKTYTFRFAPAALGALRKAGFSYLSLANNHTFDFGARGFLDTLANLSQWGIGTSGAGGNVLEASRPFIAHLGAVEVRILSFAAYPVDRTGFDGRKAARAAPDRPGTLWLDEEGLAIAARAFSPASFNIALVHGGEEWSALPTAEQRRLYTELVRAGSDLVVGSHPHVLQGMQVFQGGLIAYSLGNFLFPGMDGTDGGEDSVILKLGLYQGKIRYVVSRPVRLQGASVRLARADATRLKLLTLTRELAARAIH